MSVTVHGLSPLSTRRTTSLRAPAGLLFREQLLEVEKAGRSPVIVHPAFEDARHFAKTVGELMTQFGWKGPWGLGGECRTGEDAAHFAAAGMTWFRFDLADRIDDRAGNMSLDELDAAIVSLEDAGIYSPEWHGPYVDAGILLADGSAFRIPDEDLARAAVKFAPALEHAGHMSAALRTLWSGRELPPDVEVSIASHYATTTPAELAFLGRELLMRGIGTANHLRLAPSFGSAIQPGCDFKLEPPVQPATCPPGIVLSVPPQFGSDSAWHDCHIDNRDAASLAALRLATERAPTLFREWLAVAQAEFPSSRGGRSLDLNDDDVRFQPHVEDSALSANYLDQWQGRQLLLVTWDAVYAKLGARLSELLA